MDYCQINTPNSVTGLSTDTYYITIKPWSDYSLSLTELATISYDKLRVGAFFGETPFKSEIINLFNDYQLDVWELVNTSSGIIVHIHPYNKNYHDDDHSTLHLWVQENLHFKENSVIVKSE